MLSRPKVPRFIPIGLATIFVLTVAFLMPVTAQEEEDYSVGVQLVAEGLSAPVALAQPNDGSGRLFVVDQAGVIWIIGADGTLLPDPFLDLRDMLVELRTDYDERGVLGLAFHPDYANNGRFFVYYTAPLRAEGPAGWDHTNVLAEFHVSPDNPDMGDVPSQIILLQIDQPQFNHDSGHIAFGPDGYLYVPIGDGGGANDVDEGHTPDLGNGQDTVNLHGSILRLDVDSAPGTYAVPSDNPGFTNPAIAPEIYAYGFRNPYHISFDRGGEFGLLAADAGQDLYEEVSIVTLGGNYGWNIKEGTHCFDPANPETPPESCATTGAGGEPLIDPIIEYAHADVGVVVVGGYVYRGAAMPDLVGYYIFGDYTSSQDGPPDGTLLWAEPAEDGGPMWTWGELKVAGMENERIGANVLGFGEDNNGELYVMTSQTSAPSGDTGKVWRLVPAAGMETEGETGDMGDTGETDATPEAPPEPPPTEPAGTDEPQ